jgi:hypothetical protein
LARTRSIAIDRSAAHAQLSLTGAALKFLRLLFPLISLRHLVVKINTFLYVCYFFIQVKENYKKFLYNARGGAGNFKRKDKQCAAQFL